MLNVTYFKGHSSSVSAVIKLIAMHLNARFACCHSWQCIQDNPLSFTPRHFVTSSERALSLVCRWYYDPWLRRMQIFKQQLRERVLLTVFEAWGSEARVLPPPLIDSDVDEYLATNVDFGIIPLYWNVGLTFTVYVEVDNFAWNSTFPTRIILSVYSNHARYTWIEGLVMLVSVKWNKYNP